MNDSDLEKLTGPQQVRVMETLTQQAAGWLLGVSARAARDHTSIPRGTDGRYNAQALAKWQASRVKREELPDEDYERLRVIADWLTERDDDGRLRTALETLRAMRQAYGDGALVTLVELLLEDWTTRDDYDREREREEDTPAGRRERERAYRFQEAAAEAHREMRVTIVCDNCKKIRRGRKWIAGKPPDGHDTIIGICPACCLTSPHH